MEGTNVYVGMGRGRQKWAGKQHKVCGRGGGMGPRQPNKYDTPCVQGSPGKPVACLVMSHVYVGKGV